MDFWDFWYRNCYKNSEKLLHHLQKIDLWLFLHPFRLFFNFLVLHSPIIFISPVIFPKNKNQPVFSNNFRSPVRFCLKNKNYTYFSTQHWPFSPATDGWEASKCSSWVLLKALRSGKFSAPVLTSCPLSKASHAKGRDRKPTNVAKMFVLTYHVQLISWWFQPVWKNIRQNGNLPQRGMKI